MEVCVHLENSIWRNHFFADEEDTLRTVQFKDSAGEMISALNILILYP